MLIEHLDTISPLLTNSNPPICANISTYLKCPLCFGRLVHPLELPCRKVVCAPCLLKPVKSSGSCQCPCCNAEMLTPSTLKPAPDIIIRLLRTVFTADCTEYDNLDTQPGSSSMPCLSMCLEQRSSDSSELHFPESQSIFQVSRLNISASSPDLNPVFPSLPPNSVSSISSTEYQQSCQFDTSLNSPCKHSVAAIYSPESTQLHVDSPPSASAFISPGSPPLYAHFDVSQGSPIYVPVIHSPVHVTVIARSQSCPPFHMSTGLSPPTIVSYSSQFSPELLGPNSSEKPELYSNITPFIQSDITQSQSETSVASVIHQLLSNSQDPDVINIPTGGQVMFCSYLKLNVIICFSITI